MEDKLKILSQALNAALVLGTICVSLLLLAGYSYNVGYLGPFKLDPEVLAISFYENVSAAFTMGIFLLVEIAPRALWAIYAIFFLFVATFSLVGLSFIVERFGWENRIRDLFDPDKKVFGLSGKTRRAMGQSLEDFHRGIWIIGIVFTLFIVTPVYSTIVPYQKGVEYGKRHLKEYADVDHQCRRLPEVGRGCVAVRNAADNALLVEGMLIGATSNVVAVFDGSSSRIFSRSPQYQIEVFSDPPPVSKENPEESSEAQIPPAGQ